MLEKLRKTLPYAGLALIALLDGKYLKGEWGLVKELNNIANGIEEVPTTFSSNPLLVKETNDNIDISEEKLSKNINTNNVINTWTPKTLLDKKADGILHMVEKESHPNFIKLLTVKPIEEKAVDPKRFPTHFTMSQKCVKTI